MTWLLHGTLGVGVSEVTRILKLVSAGDTGAEDQLLRLVHDELHRIAASKLSSETPGHTLQTTALVNEAYIRLLGQKPDARRRESDVESTGVDSSEASQTIHWDSRTHFFAAAAEAMRRILVDSARRKKRQKRGGDNKRVNIDDIELISETPTVDLERLNDAITSLESQDSNQAAIVKLRYFAGMTIEQTADALGVSPATVKRHWSFAKAWLRREIRDQNNE